MYMSDSRPVMYSKPRSSMLSEVAGVEPAAAKRLRRRIGVVVIAGEHRRARGTQISPTCRPAPAAGSASRIATSMPVRGRPHEPMFAFGSVIVGRMHVGRQHRDVAGDLAEPEVLHQHLAQLLQRELLIGAVHRRAGVDHVAQAEMWSYRSTAGCSTSILTMVGTVKRLVTRCLCTACQNDLGSSFSPGNSTVAAPRATFSKRVDARAVRQRRHRDGAVALVGAGDEVGQVVGHHEGHLAMGQHRRLRAAGRSGGVEEPERVVVRDSHRRPCLRRAEVLARPASS